MLTWPWLSMSCSMRKIHGHFSGTPSQSPRFWWWWLWRSFVLWPFTFWYLLLPAILQLWLRKWLGPQKRQKWTAADGFFRVGLQLRFWWWRSQHRIWVGGGIERPGTLTSFVDTISYLILFGSVAYILIYIYIYIDINIYTYTNNIYIYYIQLYLYEL